MGLDLFMQMMVQRQRQGALSLQRKAWSRWTRAMAACRPASLRYASAVADSFPYEVRTVSWRLTASSMY